MPRRRPLLALHNLYYTTNSGSVIELGLSSLLLCQGRNDAHDNLLFYAHVLRGRKCQKDHHVAALFAMLFLFALYPHFEFGQLAHIFHVVAFVYNFNSQQSFNAILQGNNTLGLIVTIDN